MLLVTKLMRPRMSRWHLPRLHLSEILREGLSRRLTALIAAAGHGKTCTLGHFLAESQRPYVWMQLDPDDSNVGTFLQYLADGVRQELGAGSRLVTALEAGGLPSNPLPLMIADLNDCQGHVAIVLDDFHLIEKDSPVVQLVAGLLQYCGEHVHLYICSRTPLPFSTARLKVIQEAAELTEDDLRFTPGEVRTFLEHMAGMTVEDKHLEQICHLTEGWSAALVLLASGLKRRGSIGTVLDGALPSDLFSYLADEVFQSLSPDVQHFMEESAILDACSPAACDAILERKDSAEILVQLLNSNLLLTQLGPDSFRYHHLLQRFLLERLRIRESGVPFRLLHKRAGDWHLSRNLPEDAVKYYLRGEWIQEAAGLVEALAPQWLRTAKLERLRGLLAYLPTETKEQYPWISLCEARYAYNAGSPDAAMGMARLALRAFQERADARGVVQTHTLIGEIFISRQQYDAATDAYSEAARALGPEDRHEEAVLLQRRATLTLVNTGPCEAAETDLRRALSLHVELGDLPGEAAVSNTLGLIRAYLGDHRSAIQLMERSTEILRSQGEPPYEVGTNLAWVYLTVGRFRDAINIAEPMLASSSRKIQRAHAATYLLRIYARLGDFAKASAMAQTANALVEELGHRELKANLTAELAGLYRLSGQGQAAIPFANEAMQLAKQTERANFSAKPVQEAVLLHLFHTANAAQAARMVEKAMARLGGDAQPFERMMFTLALAVTEFRQSRTESRPEGVRILQEGLAECSRRGYEFFALHEWPLALTVVIYGLAYGVQPDLCLDLIRLMQAQLPQAILQHGVALMEPEARLVPAAWQALPDEAARESFSGLLTPADRRRVVSLATGPAPLRIQCLGPLAVTVGPEQIDVKALRKRKAGLLLVLLLTHDSPFPREQVIDRLWPDLDAEAADTSLRVTLHHLRRLLEPHLGGRSKSRYIQAEGGLVWFSRQPELQIDRDQFTGELSLADEAVAVGNQKEAAAHYEAACKLYRGDLSADDPYSAALEDQRNDLRERYAAALDWLGAYFWHDAQDHARAILMFKQRLTMDEAHEPAHQALIRIYLEDGQVAPARQQYAACREALQVQLGVAPARATESLLQLAISMESEGGAHAESRPARTARRR
jgi:LuxR family transcriptional regulator, maltose regulon positive regulatory protein